jgi:acetylornithine deacetylase
MNGLDTEIIREAVTVRREEIIQWTKSLIHFASENRPPRGFEAEAQAFLVEQCSSLGWETELYDPSEVSDIQEHPSWLSGRDYANNRKNLIARWPGTGSHSRARSILFSGHMDVAPYEPDNWIICRPFEPIEQEGKLYGRGSADMKGGMAAAFWALKILKDLGFQPSADILFESVVDEEFAGGNGTLAGRLKGYNADLCILPEPSRMEVSPACLGALLGDIIFRGRAGMPFMDSSIPNPLFAAARAITLSREWQKRWRAQNRHPLFEEPGKELNVMLWHIDSKASEEFTQMGTPLMVCISWIVWCHPGTAEQEFQRQFRQFWEQKAASDPDLLPFSMEILPTYHYVKPWETDIRHPGVQETTRAYQEYLGTEPKISGAAFSCDLGVYGEVGGMPSIILGPRGDNLHAPDEWVLLEDIFSLTGIYARLAASWCK